MEAFSLDRRHTMTDDEWHARFVSALAFLLRNHMRAADARSEAMACSPLGRWHTDPEQAAAGEFDEMELEAEDTA